MVFEPLDRRCGHPLTLSFFMSGKNRLLFEDFTMIEMERKLDNNCKYQQYTHFQSTIHQHNDKIVLNLHIEWGEEVFNKYGDPIEMWWSKTIMFEEEICYD